MSDAVWCRDDYQCLQIREAKEREDRARGKSEFGNGIIASPSGDSGIQSKASRRKDCGQATGRDIPGKGLGSELQHSNAGPVCHKADKSGSAVSPTLRGNGVCVASDDAHDCRLCRSRWIRNLTQNRFIPRFEGQHRINDIPDESSGELVLCIPEDEQSPAQATEREAQLRDSQRSDICTVRFCPPQQTHTHTRQARETNTNPAIYNQPLTANLQTFRIKLDDSELHLRQSNGEAREVGERLKNLDISAQILGTEMCAPHLVFRERNMSMSSSARRRRRKRTKLSQCKSTTHG